MTLIKIEKNAKLQMLRTTKSKLNENIANKREQLLLALRFAKVSCLRNLIERTAPLKHEDLCS